MNDFGPDFERLLDELAEQSSHVDQTGQWPAAQFDRLAEVGVLRWVIPEEFDGVGSAPAALMDGYERLAAACLTTTFILTQRNGACQRIASSEHDELKAELLPELASGRLFATVGVSHLTTSRQHLKRPAVQAAEHGDWFKLDGQVPWVTGAAFADYVVTGGTCENGRQVLIALPTHLDGVQMQEPATLLALNGSQTGSIRLDGVRVDRRFLLAGPVEGVMKSGSGGGAGSTTTSALAVGLSERAVSHLEQEAVARPDLNDVVRPIRVEWESLRSDLLAAVRGDETCESPQLSAESIRGRANSLVLRATQAMLAASKGAGFVAGHPAEQAVREAMFFLVWSCPQPVLTAALREFACLVD